MSDKPIRIATRASRLAIWQARHVSELLSTRFPGREVSLVPVSTIGDRDQIEPLDRLGGEGVFTREIQTAVIENRADLAVHSLKDLPTTSSAGLTLAAVPSRASMYDVLVLPESTKTSDETTATSALAGLPAAARVGTGSIRRRAQLLAQRSDLKICDVRGNVETRIAKLDAGDYDALVLAEAGLRRLGLDDRISVILRPPLMFSAVGQGALGIECRDDDDDLQAALAEIIDPATDRAVRAERRLLAALRAGCHAPLGVVTRYEDELLTLEAVVLSADGQERLHAVATVAGEPPESLGDRIAGDLLAQGADRLLTADEST